MLLLRPMGGAVEPACQGFDRNRVSPEVREYLGRFSELIPAAARSMPDAVAVVFEDVGHIPHLEATARFHSELQAFLEP